MNLKGNNAEKFATTLIIFFVLFLVYILVCIIFKIITGANLESMVKDGMSFAITGIAPVVAILLFSDWRDEHRIKSLLSTIELIKFKAKEIEIELKDSENKINSTKVDSGENVTYLYEKEEITQKLSDLYFLYEDLDKKESKIIKYRKEVESFLNKASIARNKLFEVEKNFILKSKFENLNNSKGVDEQINFTEITQKYDAASKAYKSLFQDVGNSFTTIITLTTVIKNNL